mmetsp:Transcript_1580/g.2246  ORF Transcript_1580/g.2246 Transcript_1580/m.2246 type:complete len:362 (-) Transcript_1580:953-2038(-)
MPEKKLHYIASDEEEAKKKFDGEYNVEKILRARKLAPRRRKGLRKRTHIQYLVKWLHYPVRESTWEPPEHLPDSVQRDAARILDAKKQDALDNVKGALPDDPKYRVINEWIVDLEVNQLSSKLMPRSKREKLMLRVEKRKTGVKSLESAKKMKGRSEGKPKVKSKDETAVLKANVESHAKNKETKASLESGANNTEKSKKRNSGRKRKRVRRISKKIKSSGVDNNVTRELATINVRARPKKKLKKVDQMLNVNEISGTDVSSDVEEDIQIAIAISNSLEEKSTVANETPEIIRQSNDKKANVKRIDFKKIKETRNIPEKEQGEKDKAEKRNIGTTPKEDCDIENKSKACHTENKSKAEKKK